MSTAALPVSGDDSRQRHAWLHQLLATGRIGAGQFASARSALGLVPSARAWQRILTGVFLAAGMLLLAAALVFAVAFNWAALGHFSRFAMVQGVLLLFALLAWQRGTGTVLGEAALVAASLTLGGLLALLGQTYQTGADPYSLFVVWALLLMPWALHACRASLWLLWILVTNTGLSLYCGQVLGESAWVHPYGLIEWSSVLVIVFNGALLVLFESFPVLGTARLARAVPRLLAVLVLGAVATVLFPLVGWRSIPAGVGLNRFGVATLGVGALVAIAWWYAQRQRDVLVLAAAALCAIGIGYALMLRAMPGGAAFGFFLLSAMYWIGAVALAVTWLRAFAATPGPRTG